MLRPGPLMFPCYGYELVVVSLCSPVGPLSCDTTDYVLSVNIMNMCLALRFIMQCALLLFILRSPSSSSYSE